MEVNLTNDLSYSNFSRFRLSAAADREGERI